MVHLSEKPMLMKINIRVPQQDFAPL